jgi:hypothetical protein
MDSPPFTAWDNGVVTGMTETECEFKEKVIVGESEAGWVWFGAEEGEWDPLSMTIEEFVKVVERESKGAIVDP